MTRLSPAIWMMMRCGVEDSLIGDIQEMASRSSIVRVWLQAAGAIVVGIGKDFETHWVLALRSAVFGMIVWKLLFPVVAVVVWHLTTGFIGLGLLIGLTHPDLHAATVLTMLLGVPAMVCLGWAIGRLHPTRTPMPVMAFLVAVYATWIFPYSRQLGNAIGDSRFRPYLFTQTLSVCIFTLGVLAGGIWRSGQQRHVSINISRYGITALSTALASVLVVGSLYAANDVSGRWEVEATFDDPSLAAGGFECVFKQAAERLTGSCSDGTVSLTGEVEGQTITWRAAITTFTGTLSAVDTSIEGRFSAGGNDGTFRAAKL